MRLSTSVHSVAPALLAFATLAGAQANPFPSHAEAYLSSSFGNRTPNPGCPATQQVGVTASANVSVSATCNVDANTLSTYFNGINTVTAPYGAGTQTLDARASVNVNLFSSAASVSGTLVPAADGWAQGLAYGWNYIGISNPADVFRIVLSTTVATVASSTANSQDYAYARGYLGAYGVSAVTSLPDVSLSNQLRQAGAGGFSQFDQLTSGCDRLGACSQNVTASATLAVDLWGTDLNSNGVFAALLETYSFDRAYNGGSSSIVADDWSYAQFSLPSIMLYDENGNDITSQHTITQDFIPTTVTPEPASLVLCATGLFGIAAVARRRRNRASRA